MVMLCELQLAKYVIGGLGNVIDGIRLGLRCLEIRWGSASNAKVF